MLPSVAACMGPRGSVWHVCWWGRGRRIEILLKTGTFCGPCPWLKLGFGGGRFAHETEDTHSCGKSKTEDLISQPASPHLKL